MLNTATTETVYFNVFSGYKYGISNSYIVNKVLYQAEEEYTIYVTLSCNLGK